ncbi:hypothetical protein [Desemzia sp. FAM 23989]|uniref:hypothetical protein n=1 Tax=Desemzia sp. FAM 23989 TaxID=3259523 RepID=UPI00388A9CB2
MEKRLKTTKISFLVIQIGMIAYFLIIPNHYNHISGAIWLVTSCIGLFIVAFSMSNVPFDKKSKLVLFSIFLLSIISIFLILFFVVIEFITENM